MSDRSAVIQLLAALGEVFEQRRLRWYLFGAQATLIYGQPRLTADVDVTLEIDEGDLPPLVSELTAAGFDARADDAIDFAKKTRVLLMAHGDTGLPVDIVLAGSALEREFLARAVPTDLEGVRIPVISAEDLVATKILAGRPKDLEDVRGILAERRSELDLERVRGLLALFESALDRSDLVAELDRALGSDS